MVFDYNSSSKQNMRYINILEDYLPDFGILNGARIQNQILTYNATSLYRIFTFNQKTPLYKVSLAIFISCRHLWTPVPLHANQGTTSQF